MESSTSAESITSSASNSRAHAAERRSCGKVFSIQREANPFLRGRPPVGFAIPGLGLSDRTGGDGHPACVTPGRVARSAESSKSGLLRRCDSGTLPGTSSRFQIFDGTGKLDYGKGQLPLPGLSQVAPHFEISLVRIRAALCSLAPVSLPSLRTPLCPLDPSQLLCEARREPAQRRIARRTESKPISPTSPALGARRRPPPCRR